MNKRYLVYLLVIGLLVGNSGCGRVRSFTAGSINSLAYKSIKLTATGIIVFGEYGEIESIVKNNIELFTEEEKLDLQVISNSFNDVYQAICILTSKNNSLTTKEVIMQLSEFDDIWENIELYYLEARNIIVPKINEMQLKDRIKVSRFVQDANVLAIEVESIKKIAIDEITKNGTSQPIDITVLLQDFILFTSAVSKIVAVI